MKNVLGTDFFLFFKESTKSLSLKESYTLTSVISLKSKFSYILIKSALINECILVLPEFHTLCLLSQRTTY